jgi:RNA polymerase sigma factor (TIGR02999 family)
MSEVTRILNAIEAGDPHAAAQLLPLVYDELRQLAAAQLAGEKPGQTLDATALVHEAYVRLVGDRPFADRRHFFRVAAAAMRRIVIDRARRKQRTRHGGDRKRLSLSDVEVAAEVPAAELLALDEALDRFAAKDPALFCRPVRGGSGRRPRHLPRHRQPLLDLRPCLADRRPRRQSGIILTPGEARGWETTLIQGTPLT